jgi:hypothetical protein
MTIAVRRPRNPLAILVDRLDATSETFAQQREKEAAAADVAVFARYAWILHPTAGPMRFVPWSWQLVLLGMMMTERLLSIGKARQLGVTWLAAIFALWHAMFSPGRHVLLLSVGQDEANDLIAKISFIFHRLPAWMQPVMRENTRSIRFPLLDSEIEALPATKGAGRSKTASLVILDEHGHQDYADEIYLALSPAVEHGKLFSISSFNGEGALHSRIYLEAKEGRNGFKAVFIPWSAHPQRDAEWYARKRAEMAELSDAEFTQEYPADDEEAIATTGLPIFPREQLRAMKLELGSVSAGVTIFREPAEGELYAIGADPAEGAADSDWSSASVLRIHQVDGIGYAGEQVAVMRGRWAPEDFAARLDRLARHYARHATAKTRQPVTLGWERNNHGHAVRVAIQALVNASPPPYALYRARDGKLGWLQTAESRALLVDQLAAGVRAGAIALHDAGTVGQFRTFHENEKGKPEAQHGFHDDDVFAVGIAWQLRRLLFGRVLTSSAERRRAAA